MSATAWDEAAQGAFAAALLDPQRPLPPGLRAWNGSDPAMRFAVHRNNVVASLVAALGDTFPMLRRLVGATAFDAVAAAHVRARPPRSPVLAGYGAGFADWLARHEPGQPLFADLARLEFARVHAHHAADAAALAPPAIAARLADPAALPAARLVLHPSVTLVVSRGAVASLWAALDAGDDPAMPAIDRPEGALVLREPGDEVLVVPIDPASAAFLQALQAGRPLGEAASDPGAAGLDLAAALAPAIRHGAIVGWT